MLWKSERRLALTDQEFFAPAYHQLPLHMHQCREEVAIFAWMGKTTGLTNFVILDMTLQEVG